MSILRIYGFSIVDCIFVTLTRSCSLYNLVWSSTLEYCTNLKAYEKLLAIVEDKDARAFTNSLFDYMNGLQEYGKQLLTFYDDLVEAQPKSSEHVRVQEMALRKMWDHDLDEIGEVFDSGHNYGIQLIRHQVLGPAEEQRKKGSLGKGQCNGNAGPQTPPVFHWDLFLPGGRNSARRRQGSGGDDNRDDKDKLAEEMFARVDRDKLDLKDTWGGVAIENMRIWAKVLRGAKQTGFVVDNEMMDAIGMNENSEGEEMREQE